MESEECSDSRTADFRNGMKAMEEKDYDSAVAYFQACMKKLSSQGLGLTSDLFPKCLQNIAACYNEKDDMENALSFKKFEKLYYETVLLHNGLDGLAMKDLDGISQESEEGEDVTRDRGDGSSEMSSQDSADATVERGDPEDSSDNHTSKRASEYEQLAKLCLQQECVSLALEYSGKATLLHRHHFGDDHEKTKKSFELFTSIYAEAGKKQYLESMEELIPDTSEAIPSTPGSVEETLLRHRKKSKKEVESGEKSKPLKRTRSILKKRTSNDSLVQPNSDQLPPESPRRVTFADPLPQMVRLRDEDESDNSTTNLLLFILICILIILASLLLSAVFCHLKPTVGACAEFRREITYYYNKLRYLFGRYRR